MSKTDRGHGPPVTVEEAQRGIAEAARGLPGAADPTLVSPGVATLSPYKPGPPWRDVAAELGIPEADLMMLAANENVLGPSQKAIEAGQKALQEVNWYPDGGVTKLKAALAARHGVGADHICVGQGSNEIIELLVRTFVGPGETVVTSWPSFVVYRLVAQAADREALIAPLRDDRYDLAAMAALVDRRTKLVFIANPNNPTGTYVPRRALSGFLDRIPRSVIVVLDEAYCEYATAEDYPDGIRDFGGRARLVVLRTFSKIYGLAGLRVGYGVMEPLLAQYLDRVRQPYNVNGVAQAAALAALDDHEHVRKSQRLVRDGLSELGEGVAKLGLKVVPSQSNFLVIRFPYETAEVVAKLRKEGVLVRNMRGYDMPDTIRMTVGTRAMNLKVLDLLEEIVSKG